MIPDIFATHTVRPLDQFEAWREWYPSAFDVIPKDPIGDGFPGEIRLWNLGGLAMTRTIAPSIHILRTKSHLKRDPVDHWVISYCAEAPKQRRSRRPVRPYTSLQIDQSQVMVGTRLAADSVRARVRQR